MSVDVSSMPPWKRELLERKRRQDDDDRRRHTEDVDRLSQLPSWKRELMLKKHKQKNTMVFMSKSPSPGPDVAKDSVQTHKLDSRAVNGEVTSPLPTSESSPVSATVVVGSSSPRLSAGRDTTVEIDTSYVTGGGGETVNGKVLEHLIPIQSNPWLKSDIGQRRVSSTASRHSSSRLSDHVMANDSVPQSGYSTQGVSSGSSQGSNIESEPRVVEESQDQAVERDPDNDSVFGEEEVTYGRGFVHKLLRKFKYMSAKDEQQNLQHKTSPKRAFSSDNILEDSRGSRTSPRHHLSVGDTLDGYSNLSKNKAVSVDNLLLKSKNSSFDSTDHHSTSSDENLLDYSTITIVSTENKDHIEIQQLPQPQPRIVHNQDKIEHVEEMPKSIAAARSVFESISTKKSPGCKKRVAPEVPRTSSSTNSGSVTSPVTSPSSPNLAASVQEKNQSNLINSRTETASLKRPQQYDSDLKNQDELNNARLSRAEQRSNRTTTIYDSYLKESKPINHVEDEVNANESTKPDLRTGSSGVTLTGYHLLDSSNQNDDLNSRTKQRKPTNSSGTVSASVPIPQVKADQDKKDNFMNNVQSKSTTQKISQAANEEKNIEEVTLEFNQTVKEDIKESITSKIIETKPKVPAVSKSSSVAVLSSSESSPPRNPEANRLNLNLNLNELNKKKTAVEISHVDINKNTKSIPSSSSSSSSETIYQTASTDIQRPKASKRSKRPAPTGPGSLLVRPASNLVAAGTKTEYLGLNEYHDVKKGQFAPANKPPSYYDDSDEDDVPVTNIDDYLRDEMLRNGVEGIQPREGDPSKHRKNVKKYEFEGAGVVVNRSLLTKTRAKKMRLNFLESISSMFEYPSEQFLLDTMAPEPGDFDYRDPNAPAKPQQNGSVSDDEPPLFVEPAPLKSTPGVGGAATSGLGSYQSKMKVDYYFGMEREEETTQSQPPPTASEQENLDVKPSEDDDSTWSNANSSDMLF